MGYNYIILLEENVDGEWKELYVYENSGSYNSICNHYFYTFSDFKQSFERNIKNNCFNIWFEFQPSELIEEYQKVDWKSKMIEIINSSKNVYEAKDEIYYFQESLPTYIEELEKWYNIIQKYPNKVLRIHFGLSY